MNKTEEYLQGQIQALIARCAELEERCEVLLEGLHDHRQLIDSLCEIVLVSARDSEDG